MKKDKCSHYLARGALLWGSLYTTGVSGAVYAAAPALAVDSASYPEVLFHSALICPSLGAAGGYLRWRLSRGEADTRKAGRHRLLRLRSSRKAAHRKAA